MSTAGAKGSRDQVSASRECPVSGVMLRLDCLHGCMSRQLQFLLAVHPGQARVLRLLPASEVEHIAQHFRPSGALPNPLTIFRMPLIDLMERSPNRDPNDDKPQICAGLDTARPLQGPTLTRALASHSPGGLFGFC